MGTHQHRKPSFDMSRLVYILNGPNLNLLGKRQPHIYGHETLADVERDCRRGRRAAEAGASLPPEQPRIRDHRLDSRSARDRWRHRDQSGRFTHTSVAILDALNTFEAPVIEVHISNVHKREEFRHHSYCLVAPMA